MPEMHLRWHGVTYKKTKEYKSLRKQEIQNMFTKTNQIKLIFNMTWLMETLKI